MTIVLYIHGKGGSAAESEHYKALFPNCEVFGVDYLSETPWEAGPEIRAAIQNLSSKYDDIILIANSIGAFFSMRAEIGGRVRKAFFISPVVDIEKVNGVRLNVAWLDFVRNHPVKWDVPTHILYGSRDELIPFEVIREFAEQHNATLTVMENGEHWFHTEEQMYFLDNWIREQRHLKNTIAICGLDCEKCDAFIATKNDDQALREKTAKLWAELNNAPILPEHINCEGCRMDGAKTVFCSSLCDIRKCAVAKGCKTCGDCPEKDSCPKVGAIWQNNPQAKKNLESL